MSLCHFFGTSERENRLTFFAGELVQEGNQPEEKKQEVQEEAKDQKEKTEKPDPKAGMLARMEAACKDKQDMEASVKRSIQWQKMAEIEVAKDNAAKRRDMDIADTITPGGKTRWKGEAVPSGPVPEPVQLAQKTGAVEATEGTSNVDAADKAKTEQVASLDQKAQQKEGMERPRVA